MPETEQALRAAVVADRMRGALHPGDGPLSAAVWGERGTHILTVGERGLAVWDAASRGQLGHMAMTGARQGLLSGDGATVLALRTEQAIAEQWSVGGAAPVAAFERARTIYRGTNGRLRVVFEGAGAGPGSVRTIVRDVEERRDVAVIEGRFVAMSPDGEWMAIARREIAIVAVGRPPDAAWPNGRPLLGSSETGCGKEDRDGTFRPAPLVAVAAGEDDGECEVAEAQAQWFGAGPDMVVARRDTGTRPEVFLGPSGLIALATRTQTRVLDAPHPDLPAIGGRHETLLHDAGGEAHRLSEPLRAVSVLFGVGRGFVTTSREGTLLWTAAPSWSDALHDLHLPEALEGQRGVVHGMARSPSGELLATASSDGSTSVWAHLDAGAGSVRLFATLEGAVGESRSVAFHPGGEPVLLTAHEAGVARLWSIGAPPRKPLDAFSRAARLGTDAVAFVDFEGALHVQALSDGRERYKEKLSRRELPSGSLGVRDVVWSPDGSSLAVVPKRGESRGPTVWIFNGKEPKGGPQVIGQEAGVVIGAALSPGGLRAVFVMSRAGAEEQPKLVFWDIAAARVTETHSLKQRGQRRADPAVIWGSLGSRLAVSVGETAVVLQGEPWRRETACPEHAAAITQLAFDGKDELLATGDENGEILICDVAKGARRGLLAGHTAPVTSLRWVNSRFVIAGSDDGSVRVWDTKSALDLAGAGFVLWGAGQSVRDAVPSPDLRSIVVLGVKRPESPGLVRFAFEGLLDAAELSAIANERLARSPVF